MSNKAYDSVSAAIASARGSVPQESVTDTQKRPLPELPTIPTTPSKIELKYKYEGLAEDGRPVETIVLDNIPRMAKDRVLVIAYSPTLKKEIASMVVPRIGEE